MKMVAKSKLKELEIFRISEEIRKTLKEKPYLAGFMKNALSWSKEEVKHATEMLQNLQVA